MKDLFVLWHLGLGDHIICNGLIRSLYNQYDKILLPVKHHNIYNISDMFKDLINIKIVPVTDDHDMIRYINFASKYIHSILKIGIFGDEFMKNVDTFDESFYKQASLEYSSRWSHFKYMIEKDKQLKFLDEEYIFVHDDYSRNLNIKKEYLKDLYIYRPKHVLGSSSSATIFHYISILENAKEIHCMDSSFACMIDHIPSLKNKNKFIHRYIRKESNNPNYLNNWTLIYD
jgi:hypothetical protein